VKYALNRPTGYPIDEQERRSNPLPLAFNCMTPAEDRGIGQWIDVSAVEIA
jgi:hypothetical protein